jgi:hypothetical protein
MDRYAEMLALLGLSDERDAELATRFEEDEARLGHSLPGVFRRFYETPGFIDRVGGWFSNTFEPPGRLRSTRSAPRRVLRVLWP